jgi:mercuric ion binding protein
MKHLFIWILLTIFAFSASAQNGVATIQTSGQCLECKANIEKAVTAVKGVRMATFDMETKQVKVFFNDKKTNVDAIRKAISEKGYDADQLKANPEGIEKLSPCCRPGGH